MSEEDVKALCKSHDESIRKLHNAIYGHNGEPGMLTNNTVMAEQMKTMKRDIETIKNTFLWAGRFIAAAAISLILGVVWNLILTHGPELLGK